MTKTLSPRAARINKWTSRAIFAAMFLAALVLAAPWKVTLILAYTFASTLELIPRSTTRPKWMNRLLLGGLCILWPVWLFLPSAPGDYKPFLFVEEQARFEQEYGVPDDQNASATYLRLMKASAPNDRCLPSWMKESDKRVLRRPWRSDEHPEIARWLDERAGMIEALKDLGKYGQCRFPMEPVMQAWDAADEHMETVRAWAYMLDGAANRKAGEGDLAGALEIYALISKIADHHIHQYDILDHLVGLAVENMIFDGINAMAVTGSPAPHEWTTMDAMTAAPSHDWTSTWARLMQFDCLVMKNTCCRAVYEVSTKGKVRYSRSSYPDCKGIKSPYLRSVNGKLMASGMWLVLPRSPWRFARRIDERYVEFSQIGPGNAESVSAGTKHHARFRANHEYALDMFMDIVEQGYPKLYGIYRRNVATRRACRIILLLRQCRNETGHWPANLDEVAARGGPELWTDPLNGGSFVYQLDGQAFRLYSKGLNGTDENGAGGDDFSFWPPRVQNTEKEDAPPEPK
jgi:hypothetical protein